ncbi:hypothetical protein LAZ67_3001178 [Cordylochernes scorpioides]|uniref:Tyrosine-protein phosphatase domain-containing protein n=1 Tax=Cordylochernes scorpioides TaxID=51811 RepID=A0ABY6K6U5_9ARAC|nr:hypothetical protein LAZ67_3001178 [Cordylochernes scorpioides]
MAETNGQHQDWNFGFVKRGQPSSSQLDNGTDQSGVSGRRWVAPTTLTYNDFWRMVWDHNVSVVVMLTSLAEDGQVISWYSQQEIHYGIVAKLLRLPSSKSCCVTMAAISATTTAVEKLNGQNYRLWKYNIKMLLIEKGLWDVMFKDEDTQDAQLKSQKDRALAVIALSINTEHQIHIIDCTSPQDAWKNLEQVFEPKSRSRILQLKKQFVNIKLQTEDEFILDSGATENNNRQWFTSFQPTTCEPIQTASGNLQVEGVGNIHMKMYLDTGTQDVTLNDVPFVPQARINLLSVSQTEDKGKHIKICSHKARVFSDNRVICVARNLNGLYIVRGLEPKEKQVIRLNVCGQITG